MIGWIMPLVSGLAYRLRGSSWFGNDSTWKGLRIAKLAVGAAPVGVALAIRNIDWRYCLVAVAITMAADSLPHGKDQGVSNLKQSLILTMNGVLATAGPFAALALFQQGSAAIVAICCGVLIAPAYLIGGIMPVHFRIGPLGFDQGPEIGEFLYGVTRTLFIFG